jgi:hypothetical protein
VPSYRGDRREVSQVGKHGHLHARSEGRSEIAPDTYVIRFPHGDYEYAATQRPVPSVGETVHRAGIDWVVTRVAEAKPPMVYVQRADEQLGETG